MGVEPTAARSARPATGFEDQGHHQDDQEEQGVGVEAQLAGVVDGLDRFGDRLVVACADCDLDARCLDHGWFPRHHLARLGSGVSIASGWSSGRLLLTARWVCRLAFSI